MRSSNRERNGKVGMNVICREWVSQIDVSALSWSQNPTVQPKQMRPHAMHSCCSTANVFEKVSDTSGHRTDSGPGQLDCMSRCIVNKESLFPCHS